MKQLLKIIPVKDKKLLLRALTHRSWINEHPDEKATSNERLEFLGDAVLELAVTEYLFATKPQEQEGQLTALRSALVRTETLAKIAQKLKLGKHLKLSHGEEITGGRENQSLLANTFEAVIGAIYLDQGKKAAIAFIHTHLLPELEEIVNKNLAKDAKSLLQEKAQARGLQAPTYKVESENGPDHDKTFILAVYIDGKRISTGKGKSKQQAQQQAAQSALEKLNIS